MQQTNDSVWMSRNEPAVDYDGLYQRSRANDLGLSKADFIIALERVVARRLGNDKSPQEIAAFLGRLHLEDLALTCACAQGLDLAWRQFSIRFPPNLLFRMAASAVKNETVAREAADGLYSDLYGVNKKDGQRASKLNYYSGEGSLQGWISRVLRQNCLHDIQARRGDSIEELAESGREFAAKPLPTVEPLAQDSRVTAVIDSVLAAVSLDDRFLLALYYFDGLNLKEIGNMLQVHEATISRRLKNLREMINKRIRNEWLAAGLSRRQVEELLALDIEIDIQKHFVQGKRSGSF